MNREVDYDTVTQRRWRVFLLLWGCAGTEDTITYAELARLADVPQVMLARGVLLPQIHDYCNRHQLPPLDVLAVDGETGIPSGGYAGDHEADTPRVWAYPWEVVPNMAPADLDPPDVP